MTAFVNLGFETAGASAGLASAWSLTIVNTAVDIADFTSVYPALVPWEAFELGWGNDAYLTSFVGVGTDLTQAIFYAGPAARTKENFENGWGNDFYEIELGSSAAALFGFFGATSESFGDGTGDWDTAGYMTEFIEPPDGDLVQAAFSSDFEVFEDFEDEWGQINIGSVSFTAAEFDSSPEAFEDFEEGW